MKNISITLAYVLRHGAPSMELPIHRGGFIPLERILELKEFDGISTEKIQVLVATDRKQRYTLKTGEDGCLMIRANQGHSFRIDEDELLTPVTDPGSVQQCIHGTYKEKIPAIQAKGLSRMGRQHIHCAAGFNARSGMRKDCTAYIYIDVAAAMRDGCKFFTSQNGVILTPGMGGILPPRYFAKITYA